MDPEPLRLQYGDEAPAGERLDKYLSQALGDASRTRIQQWIAQGRVRVGGKAAAKNARLRVGDLVEVWVPIEAEPARVEAEDLPLSVVYEDAWLAVVDKPKGMVVHPGHGVPRGTLANALAHRFRRLSDLGGSDRPGIVHRLDRDTTGLLVVARDNATHAALARQLTERNVHRTYTALCWRELDRSTGTFSWPLGRHARDPLRRAVRDDGKAAVTHFQVAGWFQFATQLDVELETGRTHQIRVHFAHAGHPIAGDALYGGRESALARLAPLLQAPAAGLLKRLGSQALHAQRLQFRHPHEGVLRTFAAPLPDEFRAALDYLQPYQRREP